MILTIAITCASLIALKVFALGFWVSIARTRSGIIFQGTPMEPASELAKAVRGHGNATEYAGTLIGLFALAIIVGGTPLWVGWVMIAVTAARYLTAIGFLTCQTLAKPHPLKALGAVVTYLGGVVIAAELLARAL